MVYDGLWWFMMVYDGLWWFSTIFGPILDNPLVPHLATHR